MAEQRALELGILLSPSHWQVLTCAREECLRTHRFPDVCLIVDTTRIPRAELENLFPGHTCDVIARLAGLPPKTCRRRSL
jgi:sulfur relay (sulfurtransferase) DsrC/TusE family protein